MDYMRWVRIFRKDNELTTWFFLFFSPEIKLWHQANGLPIPFLLCLFFSLPLSTFLFLSLESNERTKNKSSHPIALSSSSEKTEKKRSPIKGSMDLNHLVRLLLSEDNFDDFLTKNLLKFQVIFRNFVLFVLLPLLVLYPVFCSYHLAKFKWENRIIFVLLAISNSVCYFSKSNQVIPRHTSLNQLPSLSHRLNLFEKRNFPLQFGSWNILGSFCVAFKCQFFYSNCIYLLN